MFRLLLMLSLLISLHTHTKAPTVILTGAIFDSKAGALQAKPGITADGERNGSISYSTAIPKGKLIDLTGHTLLPGIIGMHSHLTSNHKGHEDKRLVNSQTRPALLGVKPVMGTLKENAYADMITIKGNPLNGIGTLEKVSFVMKSDKEINKKC